MPNLQHVYDAIGRLAPWELAEEWDNSGLQVGQMSQSVRKVLLAVDLNRTVLEEGLRLGVDGFIVHHPFIFKPLKQIDQATPLGELLTPLIQNNLFVLSVHTNIDNAAEGLNHYLAKIFELQEIEIIEPLLLQESKDCKVVVFVPPAYLDRVREAMAASGAGLIGAYSHCSFSLEGSGTFIPDDQAHPAVGTVGCLETVAEQRLEMVAPKPRLSQVIQALLDQHPYEEPAFDIYPLHNPSRHGLGRIGRLSRPLPLEELCSIVKTKLHAGMLRVSGPPERIIKKLALCSGSGKSLLPKVLAMGADAYLTADLTYHDFGDAVAAGLSLIDVGHYTSEVIFGNLLSEYLSQICSNNELQIIISNAIQGEPYQFI